MKTFNELIEAYGPPKSFDDPKRKPQNQGSQDSPADIASMLKNIEREFSRYDCHTEVEQKHHLVSRQQERRNTTDDINDTVNKIKNTKFFGDLDKNVGNKVHIIKKKREVHMELEIASGKGGKNYFVIFKSVMGKFSKTYQSNQREKKYYV